jgi:hypothetical protein
MKIPGFTADSSLSNPVRGYSVIGSPPDLSYSSKVVQPQTLDCWLACQEAWNACLRNCSWWEWAIGECPPKCRYQWFQCVRHC